MWSAWRIPAAVFSVSRPDPLLFLFFFHVAPPLCSQSWVDPMAVWHASWKLCAVSWVRASLSLVIAETVSGLPSRRPGLNSRSCGICSGQSNIETGFFRVILLLHWIFTLLNVPYSLSGGGRIRVCHRRWCSTRRTSSPQRGCNKKYYSCFSVCHCLLNSWACISGRNLPYCSLCHLQKTSTTTSQETGGRSANSFSHLLTSWFLARLILDPEDECGTCLRNIGSYADYTAPVAARS
jgi:hypothetical protein